MVNGTSIASINASATHPMLPLSVESKVEQYLKKICFAPRLCNHFKAAKDFLMASAAGIVLDFKETTTAAASSALKPGSGTPMDCSVGMP